MASSNIKLFDENKGNMLSDSEFSISNQRMNGLQTGVASSQLQNKAMYQASLVAYAISQIMMQNGKNANDTDAVSAFVANLSGALLQKVYDLATTVEAQAGSIDTKWMSPLKVKQYVDKNVTVVSIGAMWKESARYTVAGSFEFTVPEGVAQVRAAIAGGGGGGAAGASGGSVGFGGPGGGGGFVTITPAIPVTSGQVLSGVVGAGGAGGVFPGGGAGPAAGVAGGTSSFAGFTALGGNGGPGGSNQTAELNGGTGGANGGRNGGNYGSKRLPQAGGSNGVYIEDLNLYISAGGGAGGGYDTNVNSLTNYSTGKPGGTCYDGQFSGGHGGNAAYRSSPSTVGSAGGQTCGGGGGGGGNSDAGNNRFNGANGAAGGTGMVIVFCWGLKE